LTKLIIYKIKGGNPVEKEKEERKETPEREIKIADNSVSECFAKKSNESLLNYVKKNIKKGGLNDEQ
jgi:hypothetical protein